MAEQQDLGYPADSAAGQYERLVTPREPFLIRAREAAQLTVPSVMMPRGHTAATPEDDLYQSVGSRGCKNLASKLLLSLMPPNSPFFKLDIDESTKAEIAQGDDTKLSQIDEALGSMERIGQSYIEDNAIRVTAFEAFLHAIITGNFLLHIPDEGYARMFSLDQYVCVREANGTVTKVITKEMVSLQSLNEKQLEALKQSGSPSTESTNGTEDARPDYQRDPTKNVIPLYTSVVRSGNRWNIHQEIKGVVIEGSEGFDPIESPSFIPIRWRKIDGEDYGRGFVEEHIGDLRSLHGLSISLVEGAAAAAKVLFLVNQNGQTSKSTIADAPNLAVRDGNANDVTVLQAQKTIDLNFAQTQADRIEKRLELAFLLNTAVQRDAERVTAEEIRYVAQELEDTLGGIYSILSLEFQVPLVKRILKILQKKGKLPTFPKDTLAPKIVAGLEGLGRGHELNRLDAFITGITQLLGPQAIDKYINVSDYLQRRATALGLPTKGLLKTADEVAQANQQQAASEMIGKLGPAAINQIGANQRDANAQAAPQQSQPQPQGQ